MITLDTSALFVLLHEPDRDHARVRAELDADRGPYFIPAAILGEATYLIERDLPPAALDAFLADVEDGGYTLDCGEQDFPRARHLVRRYADLPLGFVDAAVIACAERRGGRVLTLDLRHFGVVAREGTITILP
jgi:predicted nucleic acid-binding protein